MLSLNPALHLAASLLFSPVFASPLPSTTKPHFLARRGLGSLLGGPTKVDAGLLGHAGAGVGNLVGAGGDILAHAGLSVGPDGIQVDAEVCLDLVVSLAGQKVLDAGAVLALTAGLSTHGTPANVGAVVEAHVAAALKAAAQAAVTSGACDAACKGQKLICQTSSFSYGQCSLIPFQTSPSIVAGVLSSLALDNQPDYCRLCPSKCAGPSGLPKLGRRSQFAQDLCPRGLTACPIDGSGLRSGFECIDTNEEIEYAQWYFPRSRLLILDPHQGSCGGCSTMHQGMDCNDLPGVKYPGCREGKCLAFACKAGYALVDGACITLTEDRHSRRRPVAA